jgi:hypothetical protein
MSERRWVETTSTRPHAPRNEDGFAIVNNTWVAILARPKLNSTRLDIDRMESKGQSVCREVAVCSQRIRIYHCRTIFGSLATKLGHRVTVCVATTLTRLETAFGSIYRVAPTFSARYRFERGRHRRRHRVYRIAE